MEAASSLSPRAARVALLATILGTSIAFIDTTVVNVGGDHLSVQGFHRAMLIVAVPLGVGGAIGAVGIRNPAPA